MRYFVDGEEVFSDSDIERVKSAPLVEFLNEKCTIPTLTTDKNDCVREIQEWMDFTLYDNSNSSLAPIDEN